MGRTKLIAWIYECDALGPDDIPHASLEVDRGALLATGRGTKIREQADADAWARMQGWTVTTKHVLCPPCTERRR